MTPERIWLDPGAPLAEVVARRLLAGRSRPYDFRSTLIVVPTLNAGRRLRYALARFAAESGAGVLTGPVVTPVQSMTLDVNRAGIADPQQSIAAWVTVLEKIAIENFSGLFPLPAARRDPAWTLKTGKLLQQLRRTLAEGGWRPADLVDLESLPLSEKRRWEDVSALERLYLAALTTHGLADDIAVLLRHAEEAIPPAGIQRVVLAGVPDPAPVSIRGWTAWPETLACEVLIPWTADQADAFDDWGRPRVSVWTETPLTWGTAAPCELVPTAHDVTDQVAAWLDSAGDSFALGVPESRLMEPVLAGAALAGVDAYDPGGTPVHRHAVGRLIETLLDWYREGSLDEGLHLLRHHDVAQWMVRETGVELDRVMREWDQYIESHLPTRWRELTEGVKQRAARYASLARASAFLDTCHARLRSDPLAGVLGILQDLYRGRTLQPGQPEDDAFLKVGRLAAERLRAIDPMTEGRDRLSSENALQVWWDCLKEEAYYTQVASEAVELEGWLELPWNPADSLLVVGLNEGAVPDGRIGDVFLPDTIRGVLGLRTDALRHARDAYLFELIARQRQTRGKVTWMVSRQSAEGDVLMPSRLLMQVPSGDLADRVSCLFASKSSMREPPAPDAGFALTPLIKGTCLEDPGYPDHLSASAIRDYLSCPFFYYLKRVLHTESVAVGKPELEAYDFGNLVHDAVTVLFEEASLQACTDPHLIRTALNDRVSSLMASQFGHQRPLQLLIQEEAIRQRLGRLADVQATTAREGWRITGVEVDVSITVGEVQLCGRMDRIDRHEKGMIRVLDYKSASKANPVSKAHLGSVKDHHPAYRILPDGKKSWVDVQLPLYLLFARSLYPDAMIEAGYVQLPKAVRDTAIEVWKELGDSELLVDSARDCCLGVYQDLRAKRYWPPDPSRTWRDDYAALFPNGIEGFVQPAPLIQIAEGAP